MAGVEPSIKDMEKLSTKQLKQVAKQVGLKGFSRFGKSALKNLLRQHLNDTVPEKHMTLRRSVSKQGDVQRRTKYIKVLNDLTQEEEDNFVDNPAFGIKSPTRPSAKTLKIKGSASKKRAKTPKLPKRPSKASVIKMVRAKKKKECGKYANLPKKSLSTLMGLL